MKTRFAILAVTFLLAGCDHDSDRAKQDDDHPIRIPHVTTYRSSDPNLEPTLTLGKFEIRTANGGPVILASEVERQRKAAEEQRRAQQAQRDAKP